MTMSTAIADACQPCPPGMPVLHRAIPADHEPHGARFIFHPPVFSIAMALIRCGHTGQKQTRRDSKQHRRSGHGLSAVFQDTHHGDASGSRAGRPAANHARRTASNPLSAEVTPGKPRTAIKVRVVRDQSSKDHRYFRRLRASADHLTASIGKSRQISRRRASKNFSTASRLKSGHGAGLILAEGKHSGQRRHVQNSGGPA